MSERNRVEQIQSFWTWLVAAERVVVIVAAVLAIFPLWQYWTEREDRRFDRVVNLAIASQSCEDSILQLEDMLRTGEFASASIVFLEPELITGTITPDQAQLLGKYNIIDEYRESLASVCLEVFNILRRDDAYVAAIEAYREALELQAARESLN